jgi:nitrogen fixation protein FixH
VTIEFLSTPNPPEPGDNALEVVVTSSGGSPVTDAAVEVVFSMAAMPSMNMPAMRSASTLSHQGSGRYRGNGELSMDGTWTVVVTASRGAEELARKTFSVVAN